MKKFKITTLLFFASFLKEKVRSRIKRKPAKPKVKSFLPEN